MKFYDAEPVEGSGAAQAPAAPTPEQVTAAKQALDYAEKNIAPAIYGPGKPARNNAAAIVAAWLATFTAPERQAKAVKRYADQLQRLGFNVPPPRITQAEIARRNAAVLAMVDNVDAAQAVADEYPIDELRALAAQIGMRGDLADDETRAAFAKWLADAATAQGIDLPARFRQEIGQPQGSGASFGQQLGGTLKKAVTRPGDYFQSLGEEIGKGLAATGKALLKARKIGPLGTYFLDPLGITLQATILQQLGNALIGHSVADFSAPAVGYALAGNFAAVGQALITAAPFTGPWAPLFATCGAITVAMGKTLRTMLDAQGRQAEDATGDAQARQEAEAQAAQEAAILADAQQAATVRLETNGFYYHWIYYARSGWRAAHYYDGARWQPFPQAQAA